MGWFDGKWLFFKNIFSLVLSRHYARFGAIIMNIKVYLIRFGIGFNLMNLIVVKLNVFILIQKRLPSPGKHRENRGNKSVEKNTEYN